MTTKSSTQPDRRRVLKSGVGVVVTCFAFSAGCASQKPRVRPNVDNKRLAFFLGVASADPQPEAILLWSRVEPLADESEMAKVVVQLSRTNNFERILLEQEVTARPTHDYTMRVLIDDLEPRTTYFYRFIASDGAVSRTGRTWTAPKNSEDVPLAVALASCQSYPPSKYGAYRHLINEEKRTRRRPDFVLHVGDYVYGVGEILPFDPETGMSGPPPEDYDAPQRRKDSRRPLTGGGANEAALAAETDFEKLLAGRRRIYHAYHRDMDLQDARALYPFVCTWDDHEFGNDVWQSFDGKPNQVGRLAATQAWYEFVPQILSDSRSINGVKNHARDFMKPDGVKNAPFTDFDEDFLANNPDNLKVINAMTSYRSICWGKNADIVVTDTRSYRGPGANPSLTLDSILGKEEYEAAYGGFTLYDGEVAYVLAKGRNANGGNPPETIVVKGEEIPNPRAEAPEVSMLGRKQKEWFKESVVKSNARWKIWAVASPVCNFRFDPEHIKPGTGIGYNWTDGWDGYPNEREELLDFIWDNKIGNVVSLTGDRHAHYAGIVVDRLEKDGPLNVMPEFTCTGISAFPRWRNMFRTMSRLGLGEFCRAEIGGKTVTTMDMMMTKGSRAVAKAIASDKFPDEKTEYEHVANPHLHYADNDAHGYVFAEFGPGEATIEFITLPNDANWDPGASPDGPSPRRVVGFSVPEWSGGNEPTMKRTLYEGERIFDSI